MYFNYQVGDRVTGVVINNEGEEVTVEGVFVLRTDDPEEYIQDIVIRTDDGEIVYIDEQHARPVKKEDVFTIAKVLDGFADLSSERFHTFIIKKNGEVFGKLKWTYRPKSAGGYAWKGTKFNAGDCGMDISFFHKNKQAVLDWFKTGKVT